MDDYNRRYRRSKRGLLIRAYSHQRERMEVEYNYKDLLEKYLDDKKFNRLYEEWVKSGYKKQLTPSIDRINCRKKYTLDNIHVITWGDNRYKRHMERKLEKGKIFQIKDGIIIKTYRSQVEAVRKTGIKQGNIGAVISGIRKTAGGYGWKYEKPQKKNKKRKEGTPPWERKIKRKLKRGEVLLIKKLAKEGVKQRLMAKVFNVDITTISNIKVGKTWKWV